MSINLSVLLISTYEMGRQPFGLASPAAWLQNAGATVDCLDLSVEPLRRESVQAADLIAFYVPMHMATRMAMPVLARVQQINPDAHICFYGLYAVENERYLRNLGVDTVLGGEFESGILSLAMRLSRITKERAGSTDQVEPIISLDRQDFLVPDRSNLPGLSSYAHLVLPSGEKQQVGYVEASRGCKHLCRHCPIVPVYNGQFKIVQKEVVMEDIRSQVMAGAQHITFGDPDFFNGPGHSIPIIKKLHDEFPGVTYDVTIKVEHLHQHLEHLPMLKETGCLFITTAVESFDDNILSIFQKEHTRDQFEAVLGDCRKIDLQLVPTFVAFTPWTTLASYRQFLNEIVRLELVDHVPPIQYTIRLLIPPGSKLLDLAEMQDQILELEESKFSYKWVNPDPRVDQLQKDLEKIVMDFQKPSERKNALFKAIYDRVHTVDPNRPYSGNLLRGLPKSQRGPYLTEPWYC